MCLITTSSVIVLTQREVESGQPGAVTSAAEVPMRVPRPGGPGTSVGGPGPLYWGLAESTAVWPEPSTQHMEIAE